jgi:hypothetical protein
MCNALRLYFRREVIGRPQVTVQNMPKMYCHTVAAISDRQSIRV